MGGFNIKLAKKIATVLMVSVLIAIFSWRLGNLVPGLSPAESSTRASSQSWQSLTRNPLNAPHRLIQLGFSAADHMGAFWMRLASVIFGLIFIAAFYLLARLWFGTTIGLLATVLFATTPWLILISRSGTANIMLLSPLLILVSYSWLIKDTQANRWAWLALGVAIAIGLYVPGVFWFVVLGGFWTRKYMASAIDAQRVAALTCLFLIGILIAPLVWSMAIHPDLLRQWLAIPSSWPPATEVLKSVGWACLSIFWQLPGHLDFVVGRLPLLNIAQAILSAFGLFALFKLARRQMYGLVGFILVAVVLAGLNRDMRLLSLSLPALGLIAGAGLRYLYLQWRQIFPLNPLPRALAIFLLCLMVLFNLGYGVKYSLAAWPRSLETRRTYVLK